MSFAAQFAHPTGWKGRIAGWLMARSNQPLADWALDLLAAPPEAVLLEVGCGPGRALGRAAARVPRGRVIGIDPSAVMRDQALAHLRRFALLDRVDVQAGEANALPVAANSVDGAFAVNSSPFWPDLPAGLRELARVLRPGSPLSLVVLPRWLRDEAHVRALAAHHRAAVEGAGFQHVVTGFRALSPVGAFSLVARAPV